MTALVTRKTLLGTSREEPPDATQTGSASVSVSVYLWLLSAMRASSDGTAIDCNGVIGRVGTEVLLVGRSWSPLHLSVSVSVSVYLWLARVSCCGSWCFCLCRYFGEIAVTHIQPLAFLTPAALGGA